MFFEEQDDSANILIADDDESSLLVLKDVLQGMGNIIEARDGNEAVSKSRQMPPDLAFLDIDMPGKNGMEVCAALKNDPSTFDTSIIFITSEESIDVQHLSFSLGALDFLTKPIDYQSCRLRARNHLLLRSRSKALEAGRNTLDQLLNQLPVSVTYWTSDWRNIFSNEAHSGWFNTSRERSVDQVIERVLPAHLASEVKAVASTMGNQAIELESSYTTLNQTRKFVRLTLAPTVLGGYPGGYLLTLTDITSIREAEQQLQGEKERFRVTLNSIGDAVIATDTEGFITFMNPIAERMTGWSSRDGIGSSIAEVMELQDATTKAASVNPVFIALKESRIVAMALNSQLTGRDGTLYRVEDSAAPIRNESGEVEGAIIVFHDISETVAMSMKMSHLANHDQLTDLPNRILLQDRLNQAFNAAGQLGSKVAVMLIDIDHFKYLNDSFGHGAGDELIRQMASRLKDQLDVYSTLARSGGDEFMVVFPHVKSVDQIDRLSAKLISAMHKPFSINSNEYNISISMGISVYPDDAKSQDEVMRHADVAMFRAKHEGRNRYCYFSSDLEQMLINRHFLEKKLRTALQEDALEVFYQPKYNLADRTMVGVEALARLNDGDQIISPLEFIPLAEEMGLIEVLGRQVLTKACRDALQWQRAFPGLTVSVNVAPTQILAEHFTQGVREVLRSTRLDPTLLELEVTESALMHDVQRVQDALNQLHGMGIKIAIDDFGTGYSNLSYLKKFNLDVLKIDQSFVRDMTSDQNDLDIVKTIMSLGASMNLTLIAEGIETLEHENMLKSLGCLIGQGFYFAGPLPLAKLYEFGENADLGV
jgi:diguanylate cyclase (GGDEF)-like protein/PAS domain S-box-containing protein